MAMNAHDYIASLVAKAKAAQEIANGFTQEDVDLLTGAVAYALTKPEVALKFGEMLVEESGMGIAEDKVGKFIKVEVNGKDKFTGTALSSATTAVAASA